MQPEPGRSKPAGFNLCTRLVFVHAAFSIAVLTSALPQAIARGHALGAVSAGIGLLIAATACWAMVGVARQRSPRALLWLRWILWLAVLKIALGWFGMLGSSGMATGESLTSTPLNEAAVIALVIYWSRPVHASYLADSRCVDVSPGA